MLKPTSLPDLLSTRLLRLSNSLGLYSSRHYRQQFGVSLPEWRVMSIVASRDKTTAREVSRVLATDKAWVAMTVRALAKQGFLTRSSDKEDSRRVLLSLTKTGRELHDRILTLARLRHKRLLAALPPDGIKLFSDCLDILQAEADDMLAELGERDDDAP